jgi:hypothetical protein
MEITKCKGKDKDVDCPFKENCFRYRAIPEPSYQIWLMDVPYDKESDSCNLMIDMVKVRKKLKERMKKKEN